MAHPTIWTGICLTWVGSLSMIPLEQWLTRRILLLGGHLTMSGHISDCHNGWRGVAHSSWHLASRGQGCYKHPIKHRTDPTIRIIWPKMSILQRWRNSALESFKPIPWETGRFVFCLFVYFFEGK